MKGEYIYSYVLQQLPILNTLAERAKVMIREYLHVLYYCPYKVVGSKLIFDARYNYITAEGREHM